MKEESRSMMTKTILAGVLLLGLGSAAFADGEADIVDVLEAYSSALVGQEVAAAETHVLAEGDAFTIFEGSGADIGWEQYRDHHLVPEFANQDVEFHVYDWSGYSAQTAGEFGFATFDIRMEYEVRGESRERDGHGTAILVRTENGWRIRHLHTS